MQFLKLPVGGRIYQDNRTNSCLHTMRWFFFFTKVIYYYIIFSFPPGKLNLTCLWQTTKLYFQSSSCWDCLYPLVCPCFGTRWQYNPSSNPPYLSLGALGPDSSGGVETPCCDASQSNEGGAREKYFLGSLQPQETIPAWALTHSRAHSWSDRVHHSCPLSWPGPEV